ncbi:DUF89 family protein [Candidatus Poribacteria bacterium]|nr:DUF89 family protein [Candidatus Poribacteria bacterium]
MKSRLDCFPCCFAQVFRTGMIATDDQQTVKHLLDEVGDSMKELPLGSSPPEILKLMYEKIRDITGNFDPYKEIKQKSTENALKMYPYLKKIVAESEDRLFTAVKLAIAGNVIDMGIGKVFDVEHELDKAVKGQLAICDYEKFKGYLNKAEWVLYLGDNAGESVLDRVLIEELGKPVVFVVRGTPIINDVIYEDAVQAGIDKVTDIITSGTSSPGTLLDDCTDEFKEIYYNADMIISKGQGNYEALSTENAPIFFLLKAKCHVIAEDIGVNEGDIILKGPES